MEHSNSPLINTYNSPQYKKLKTTVYCLNIIELLTVFRVEK